MAIKRIFDKIPQKGKHTHKEMNKRYYSDLAFLAAFLGAA